MTAIRLDKYKLTALLFFFIAITGLGAAQAPLLRQSSGGPDFAQVATAGRQATLAQPDASENIEQLRMPITKEQTALVREILQDAHTQSEEKASLLIAVAVLGVSAAVIIAGILLWRASAFYNCNELCRLHHHHRDGAHCRIELLGLWGLEGHHMHSPDNGDQ